MTDETLGMDEIPEELSKENTFPRKEPWERALFNVRWGRIVSIGHRKETTKAGHTRK